MWTKNFQVYKLGFEETEEPEMKFPTFIGSWKKQASSRKSSTSASLTKLNLLTMWITTNYGKFLKIWEYQTYLSGNTTLLVSWETYMQVKKQQLEPYMEERTGSKLGKEYNKTVYCHLAYLTYMQSTSYEMPCWMNYKLESRLLGEISTTAGMQMMLL